MKRCTATGLLLLTLAGAPVVVWLTADHFQGLTLRLIAAQHGATE